MDPATFSRRIRRADFLDGLGIYVEAGSVSLAHVTKRLLQVAVREVRTVPLPPANEADARIHALSQAIGAFVGEARLENAVVHLCLPRSELLLNRIALPAAARENLQQVLEYEIERAIPLPRDEVFYDWQVRESGVGEAARLAILLVCVPRRVVNQYVGALELAGTRPKAIVISAAALGDYVAFCRGPLDMPIAVGARSSTELELAVFVQGKLIASHALRGGAPPPPAEVQAIVQRDLAEVFAPNEGSVEVLAAGWGMNGGPPPDDVGDLFAIAHGNLDVPPAFFEGANPGVLPAVGAALGAVRERSVDINLLPEEHRQGLQEGLFVPIVLLVAAVVLALVYGGSVVVRDEMTRQSLAAQVEELEPQVSTIKKQENEARKLTEQIEVLTANQDRRMVSYLRELTEKIPLDAYLTTLRYRNSRIEIDGFAGKSSELIKILEASPLIRGAQFSSPTTVAAGGQERFAIVGEVEK
jgi:Tfp pilus assembly protein PilN